MNDNGFIPVVPFDSYSDYEKSLRDLVRDYQAMVVKGVQLADLSSWIDYGIGISFERDYWIDHGELLFLRFTKGHGRDWCDTMNIMVLHALECSLRVLLRTREKMGDPMEGSEEDRLEIAELFKTETEMAIADPDYDNRGNMCMFEDRNFKSKTCDILREPTPDEDDDFGMVPLAQAQAKQMAFAMIGHPRLGDASIGRMLGHETVQQILQYVFD